VLGVDPLDAHWEDSSSGRAERLSTAADTLISSLLKRRYRARAEKDFAAADVIRAQLNEAGIEIEDTPQGPRWAL
jgi:cysteinyl-tRNA synthetase